MQDLIKDGIIIEKNGFQSISYILNDEKRFILSNYKIMQSMENDGLLRCNKILHNGKTKLVYNIGEMKSLNVICRYMHYTDIINILCNLIDIIIKVEGNGFLNTANLDCSIEHIVIDSETFSPHVIYLPLITQQNTGDISAEIRENLKKVIEAVTSIAPEERSELYNYINEQSLSFQQLRVMLQSKINGIPVHINHVLEDVKEYNTAYPEAKMILRSKESIQEDLEINKAEFTIGKLESAVDGYVASVTVSRKHCVITNTDGKYYIEDLDSTNGTKVNDIRIPSHIKTQINAGDFIKIADVKFQVEI